MTLPAHELGASSGHIVITGLQADSGEKAFMEAYSHLPLTVQVEMDSAEAYAAEAVLELSTLWGDVVFRHVAPMEIFPGRGWSEISLPPGLLHPGRYLISVGFPDHDAHICRHPLAMFGRPSPEGPDLEQVSSWSSLPGDMPRISNHLYILQVRLRTAGGGAEPALFPSHAGLQALIRLNLRGLPNEPLIRFQLFSPAGELLFGTNTNRWDIALDSERKEASLTLDLEHLNLAPGQYHISVGVWGDEQPGTHPIECMHGWFELLVLDGLPHGA